MTRSNPVKQGALRLLEVWLGVEGKEAPCASRLCTAGGCCSRRCRQAGGAQISLQELITGQGQQEPRHRGVVLTVDVRRLRRELQARKRKRRGGTDKLSTGLSSPLRSRLRMKSFITITILASSGE